MIANYADHSANERTFLAWLRTAIAIVGFGLASARLGTRPVQVWSEVAMLLAGALVVGIAFVRMRHVRRRICAREMLDDDAAPADGLLVLLIGALFALMGTFVLHVG
ncbi:MAG: DUF202 domain-containing protein [Rhodobacteraceae bacterium]|nr:DUF202 domain-containing protein [Paracoccaceae bacterium]